MRTQAQRRFDSDYVVLRRLLLQGKTKKNVLRAWIKVRGEEAASAAEVEVRVSRKLVGAMKRQSSYELDLMDDIHMEDGDDKKDGGG